MGTIFSSDSSSSNPTDSQPPLSPATSPPPTMSSTNQDPKTPQDKDNQETISQLPEEENENEKGEKEEEEKGECGFCVFMKGGGCKEAFIEWENCVMDSETKRDDIVEKCHDITFQLKECMQANADYYEPILRAERAAEEELNKEMEMEIEMEKEREKRESGGDDTSGNQLNSTDQKSVN